MNDYIRNNILKDTELTNPYGIYSSLGGILSHEDTIDLFERLKVTPEELDALNKYVLESDEHSFYGNPYGIYSEDGGLSNFIDGYRLNEDEELDPDEIQAAEIKKQYKRELLSLKSECHFENEIWEANIRDIQMYPGYYVLIIEGKGTKIKTYLGNSDEYWILFPEFNIGTSIAAPWNKEWNIDNLTSLFGNVYDAITVASMIEVFGNQVPIL